MNEVPTTIHLCNSDTEAQSLLAEETRNGKTGYMIIVEGKWEVRINNNNLTGIGSNRI